MLFQACLALLGVVTTASALGGAPSITFDSTVGGLPLAGHGVHDAQILVDADDFWGVQKAAGDLAVDFGRVTGTNFSLAAPNARTRAPVYRYRPTTNFVNYTVGPWQEILSPVPYTDGHNRHGNPLIIAGTIGKSRVIDDLVKSGKIQVNAVEGQWESYVSSVVANPMEGVKAALVIAGSDMRGTIFGLYDISEQIGVSPWYFWADVPAKPQKTIYAMNLTKTAASPSIKYRGFFLNDEQPALTAWVVNNFPNGTYGAGFDHNMYHYMFELLLRLKANYLWPAMWGSMFNVDDVENQPLADAYGVVMGTSHTEPMMRATNEWGHFGKGPWEWSVNNASIKPFFEYGAERAKPYVQNSLFTMAMRGSGDTSINLPISQAIFELEDVVSVQQQILGAVFNDTGLTVTDIPQMWCLYKEVQGYYQAGMRVPDEITLLWADDNWGNVRRLPLKNETSRAGGAGVYYHFDFVGGPRDYKWINTINLEKTTQQMHLSYALDAHRIWIVNVGDMKGNEIPINHFMDLAYNISRWDINSTSEWLTLWAAREFGSQYASEIAAAVDKYGVLAAMRKYELVDYSVYSLINYNEAGAVLSEWEELAQTVQQIYDSLPSAVHAAFFELVLHPVLAGMTVYKIHIGSAMNVHYADQGRNSANDVAHQVLADFQQDANLTHTYHSILDGKWNGIMSQTHLGYSYWQEPMQNTLPHMSWVQTVFESMAGDVGFGVDASNASVPGNDMYHPLSSNNLDLLPLERFGAATRYIDVFSRGSSCEWQLSAPSYLELSQTSGWVGGSNGTDTRVYVSVRDWTGLNETTTALINASTSCTIPYGFSAPQFRLPLYNRELPASFSSRGAGFVESDATVAMEAVHFQRQTSVGGVSYMRMRNYGRTLGTVMLTPFDAPPQSTSGSGPMLEYDFYTFTNTTAQGLGPANITLLLGPSLNYQTDDFPMQYAIQVDDEPMQLVAYVGSTTGGNLPKGWNGAVANAVWGLNDGLTTTQHMIEPGAHTLKIWAMMPGVYLQKVIVDLGGVRPSYLGPPESFRVGVDQVGSYNGTSFRNAVW